jgi:hypothetical protein
MAHKDRHPVLVDGCFGCKVDGIGYDSGVRTRTKRDEAGNDITEHRTGQIDVTINARPLKMAAGVRNL